MSQHVGLKLRFFAGGGLNFEGRKQTRHSLYDIFLVPKKVSRTTMYALALYLRRLEALPPLCGEINTSQGSHGRPMATQTQSSKVYEAIGQSLHALVVLEAREPILKICIYQSPLLRLHISHHGISQACHPTNQVPKEKQKEKQESLRLRFLLSPLLFFLSHQIY